MTLRLVPITADNLEAALEIRLMPGQERWVGSVAKSLSEAYVHGDVAWPRLILDDDTVVGFVMAFLDIEWDPEDRPGLRRSGIWRLNVSAGHQSRGVGRFAVAAVCEEIRRRGIDHTAYVTWSAGKRGPEGFYRRLGFEVLDELAGEERIGRLGL